MLIRQPTFVAALFLTGHDGMSPVNTRSLQQSVHRSLLRIESELVLPN